MLSGRYTIWRVFRGCQGTFADCIGYIEYGLTDFDVLQPQFRVESESMRISRPLESLKSFDVWGAVCTVILDSHAFLSIGKLLLVQHFGPIM